MQADRSDVGRLVVITGLPGSGKTTLARALAASLPAVRMCPDDWMMASGIDLWDADARARVEQFQLELALPRLSAGVNVVIEWGVWTRAERDALRDAARAVGAPVELRYVTAPVDELWRRIVDRDVEGRWASRSITRAELDEWHREYEAPSAEELATYDPPTADATEERREAPDRGAVDEPVGGPHVVATLDWTAGLRPAAAPRTHRTSARGVVAGADGRILFVRTGDGHLMLPGGGIEDGESEADCIRREVAEETGVVVDSVGDVLGTCTELNPDRDGTSIWAFECRYRAATTDGTTVAPNLLGYERDLELTAAWLHPGDALAALAAQLGAPGRPGCWALRELPIVAAWLSRGLDGKAPRQE